MCGERPGDAQEDPAAGVSGSCHLRGWQVTCDVPFLGRLYIASKASYNKSLFLQPAPVLQIRGLPVNPLQAFEPWNLNQTAGSQN